MPALEAVRKFSQKSVKVLAWVSCHASALIYPFAPIGKGGRGDYRPKVMMEAATSGKPVEEVAERVSITCTAIQEGTDNSYSGHGGLSRECYACSGAASYVRL